MTADVRTASPRHPLAPFPVTLPRHERNPPTGRLFSSSTDTDNRPKSRPFRSHISQELPTGTYHRKQCTPYCYPKISLYKIPSLRVMPIYPKKVNDGWPESAEEQGLLLLVWRRKTRNDIWKMCYRQSRRGVLKPNSEKCKTIVCIADTLLHT